MIHPLIQLKAVDVAVEGITILRGITWRLMPGEHWAISGGNGSGKSTLLKLLRGELAPVPGSGQRAYAFNGQKQTTAVGVKEAIALVSPELQSRYLQQEWTLNGLQVVYSGFGGGDYVYVHPTHAQRRRADTIIRLLGIAPFLSRNAQELSTGELRKILIARALAGNPRVLACDEICDGLDSASRLNLLQSLDRVARHGTQLLYVTHRAEEMLPSITHRVEMQAGRIARQLEIGERREKAEDGECRTQKNRNAKDASLHLSGRRTLVSIRHADVFLGPRRVLRDIHLKVCVGEHWAILGPNGAGKSTLLKLMLGDVHPAWGGRVTRFSFTAKNTLWEVKQKIGFVSPELQSNYRERLTGAQVISSGFFSSVGLARRVSRARQRRVEALVERLGLRDLASRNTLEMSYGEFRRILLARALVHGPELLICDEPFDGLDAKARGGLRQTLEDIARQGTSLVMVTHHTRDLPTCITHIAELKAGRIVFQGLLAQDFGRPVRRPEPDG